MSVDKRRLIEEVRKRPLLWDSQLSRRRNNMKCALLWGEIEHILGVDVDICKRVWRRLRVQFIREVQRAPARVVKAKEQGVFDPKRSYYVWKFFDSLKFLKKGIANLDSFLTLENDSEKETNVSVNTDQRTGNSFQTASEEYSNSDQTQSDSEEYSQNDCKSANDIVFIINNNLEQVQLQRKNYSEENPLANKNNDTCQVAPTNDSQDLRKGETSFNSYTISLSELTPESEYARVPNENANLQDQSAIINPSEKNATQASTSKVKTCDTKPESIISPNNHDHHAHTSSSVCSLGSVDTNDQDYSFLYSFLPQIKLMTNVHKMDFYVNMKASLLHVCPDISSASILDKQLMLPKYADSDENFLFSFWPFVKAMPLSQNLQFRLKMANLIYHILFPEAKK